METISMNMESNCKNAMSKCMNEKCYSSTNSIHVIVTIFSSYNLLDPLFSLLFDLTSDHGV